MNSICTESKPSIKQIMEQWHQAAEVALLKGVPGCQAIIGQDTAVTLKPAPVLLRKMPRRWFGSNSWADLARFNDRLPAPDVTERMHSLFVRTKRYKPLLPK